MLICIYVTFSTVQNCWVKKCIYRPWSLNSTPINRGIIHEVAHPSLPRSFLQSTAHLFFEWQRIRDTRIFDLPRSGRILFSLLALFSVVLGHLFNQRDTATTKRNQDGISCTLLSIISRVRGYNWPSIGSCLMAVSTDSTRAFHHNVMVW